MGCFSLWEDLFQFLLESLYLVCLVLYSFDSSNIYIYIYILLLSLPGLAETNFRPAELSDSHHFQNS